VTAASVDHSQGKKVNREFLLLMEICPGGENDLGNSVLDPDPDSLNAGDPDLNAADPDLNAADPDLNAADPDLNDADPDLNAADPDLNAGDPAPYYVWCLVVRLSLLTRCGRSYWYRTLHSHGHLLLSVHFGIFCIRGGDKIALYLKKCINPYQVTWRRVTQL
jgi:hypothetical protein